MNKAKNRVVKIDDIVTVVSDRSMYNGEQGTIVEIDDEDGDEDGPIGVKFDRDQIMHHVLTPEECVVRHEDDELHVDERWSCKRLAERLYPRYHHSTSTLTFAFDSNLPCMSEGAEKTLHSEASSISGEPCAKSTCATRTQPNITGSVSSPFHGRRTIRFRQNKRRADPSTQKARPGLC